MKIDRVVMHFGQFEAVPIQVDQVVEHLRVLGVTDEIYFFDVDIDTSILKGKIDHWKYPASEKGPERRVADINTASSLSVPWRRLVQCKELLHVVDADHFRVNTFESVESLINDIVVPVDIEREHTFEAVYADSDRWGIYHAVAVLFPLATRDLLMEPYKAGKIDLDYIADLLDLPKIWVAKVMSDEWFDIHHRLVRPQRIAGPDRVTFLKQDGSPIEVHSVPIGWNPYSYAQHMLERQSRLAIPPVRCLFERDGNRMILTEAQIEARLTG